MEILKYCIIVAITITRRMHILYCICRISTTTIKILILLHHKYLPRSQHGPMRSEEMWVMGRRNHRGWVSTWRMMKISVWGMGKWGSEKGAGAYHWVRGCETWRSGKSIHSSCCCRGQKWMMSEKNAGFKKVYSFWNLKSVFYKNTLKKGGSTNKFVWDYALQRISIACERKSL